MLSSRNRFQKRYQIREVKEKGKLFSSSLFGLLVLKKENQKLPRIAFIISTKIHKKATRRNYLKRLLAEAVKTILPQTKKGTNCLFLAKKALLHAKLETIKQEIKETFKKANVFN